ncbi:MAG: DNA alkylation repair protein [Clostridiales bacterium]|nr:DNA alkylation repair protein [Clostridiales bacterium]
MDRGNQQQTMSHVYDLLKDHIDEGYKQFNSKLIPNYPPDRMLGVRMPVLRKVAKQLAKKDAAAFLQAADFSTYESTMLFGMVIGYAAMPYDEKMKYTQFFLPRIDNWAVCDCVCSTLKFLGEEREKSLSFIKEWIHNAHEYTARFGLVSLLQYYVTEEWIEAVLAIVHGLSDREYYFNMAAAWLFAECMICYPRQSEPYLQTLPPEIKKLALRKVRESRRSPSSKH